MNGNFNMVKKNKDEDEDYEEESTTETSHVDSSEIKSKMIKLMVFIIGGFVILLIVLVILSSLSPKSYTYREIENILKTAAVNYFKDNPESLPVVDGNIIEIDSSTLYNSGYMKELGEYLPEGAACTGKVQVLKTTENYLYTPYLNCGESYSTTELYKKICLNN